MRHLTNIRFCTILLLILLFTIESKSQQTLEPHYYFKTLDTNNGLAQNTVSSIIKDRRVFMWFATKEGVDCYNGLSIRHFNHYNSGFGCDFVQYLMEDVEGLIWIGATNKKEFSGTPFCCLYLKKC